MWCSVAWPLLGGGAQGLAGGVHHVTGLWAIVFRLEAQEEAELVLLLRQAWKTGSGFILKGVQKGLKHNKFHKSQKDEVAGGLRAIQTWLQWPSTLSSNSSQVSSLTFHFCFVLPGIQIKYLAGTEWQRAPVRRFWTHVWSSAGTSRSPSAGLCKSTELSEKTGDKTHKWHFFPPMIHGFN